MNRTTLSSLVISAALLASGVAIHLFAVEPAADAAPPPAVAAGPVQHTALAAAPAPPASLDPLDAREQELDRRERALDERAALADGVFRDLELQRAWVEERVAAVTSGSVRRMPQLSGFLASDPTAPLPVVAPRVEVGVGSTGSRANAVENAATSARAGLPESARPPAEPSPISTTPPSSPSPPPGEVPGPPVVWGNGAFAPTQRGNDLAIDGRGWFVVQGASQRLYTRWGRFGIDASGRIVDSVGQPVLGYGIDPETGRDDGVLGEMQVPTTLAPPRRTTAIELSANLDGTATIVVGGFDPANPSQSSELVVPIDVYDSLGQQHSLNVFFTKIARREWEWHAALAPSETTRSVANPRDLWVVQGSGMLSFGTSGGLREATGTTFLLEFAEGAEPGQVVTLAFVDRGDRTTQYGHDSAVNGFSQDGQAPGTLQFTFWDAAGYLNGSFSNGETIALARIALASFWNPDGLEPVNGTDMAATATSGDPHIAAPLTDGLGRILAAVLEQPDVGPWQCIPTSNDIHAGSGS